MSGTINIINLNFSWFLKNSSFYSALKAWSSGPGFFRSPVDTETATNKISKLCQREPFALIHELYEKRFLIDQYLNETDLFSDLGYEPFLNFKTLSKIHNQAAVMSENHGIRTSFEIFTTGVNCGVLTVLGKLNLSNIEKIVDEMAAMGVNRITANLFCGKSEDERLLELTALEKIKTIKRMELATEKYGIEFDGEWKYAVLQMITGAYFSCQAGIKQLVFVSDGTIYPFLRVPYVPNRRQHNRDQAPVIFLL